MRLYKSSALGHEPAPKHPERSADADLALQNRPPEKLLRAQLIQMLYSVRSERLLMDEIDYSLLFRRFVGMNLDEPVWDVTVSLRRGRRTKKWSDS